MHSMEQIQIAKNVAFLQTEMVEFIKVEIRPEEPDSIYVYGLWYDLDDHYKPDMSAPMLQRYARVTNGKIDLVDGV